MTFLHYEEKIKIYASLHALNNCHPSFKFTHEIEIKITLNVLDVLVAHANAKILIL